MSRFAEEDIFAYCFDQELVCPDCITSDEKSDLRQDQILTRQNAESTDDVWFCDRCDKKVR